MTSTTDTTDGRIDTTTTDEQADPEDITEGTRLHVTGTQELRDGETDEIDITAEVYALHPVPGEVCVTIRDTETDETSRLFWNFGHTDSAWDIEGTPCTVTILDNDAKELILEDHPICHPRHLSSIREDDPITIDGPDVKIEGRVEWTGNQTGRLTAKILGRSPGVEYKLTMNGYGMVRVWAYHGRDQDVIWTGHSRDLTFDFGVEG